jgi:hypothetical protein
MLQPDGNHIPLRVSGNDAIPGVPPLPITVGLPFHNLYGRGLIVAKKHAMVKMYYIPDHLSDTMSSV